MNMEIKIRIINDDWDHPIEITDYKKKGDSINYLFDYINIVYPNITSFTIEIIYMDEY